MARKSTGEVVERQRKTMRTFALRFRAYGQRHYISLGSAEEGWTRMRAEEELANVMADVRRGIWRPPEPMVESVEPEAEPTFHEFASEWFEGLRHEGLAENTLLDYEWQLTHHLLPHFRRHRLSEITIADVDRYRQSKVREGRLSPTSINKTITRLAQILEVAVEREMIERNPARGKRRRLKQPRPERTWLDRPEHIAALLDAAGELDAEARGDRRAISRRALLGTMAFGGLRIGEALGLRWRDVDLAAGWLHVGRSKTDAGVRQVSLLPALREELTAHKAQTRFAGAADLVFPTEKGRPQGASNVRRRILARAVERANERRIEEDLSPLPEGLTPHSLRRTFASLLYALGRSPVEVMDQLGHTDPKLALSIYARVMRREDGQRERLRALVEGADLDYAEPQRTPEDSPREQ